jgi:hypothetical protein
LSRFKNSIEYHHHISFFVRNPLTGASEGIDKIRTTLLAYLRAILRWLGVHKGPVTKCTPEPNRVAAAKQIIFTDIKDEKNHYRTHFDQHSCSWELADRRQSIHLKS